MNTSMSLSAVVALIFILLGVAVCYINRQDNEHEQERCIKAAQDWCCFGCGAQPKCKIDGDEVGHPAFGGKCMDRVKVRKAIEEGGEV